MLIFYSNVTFLTEYWSCAAWDSRDGCLSCLYCKDCKSSLARM